MLSIDPETNLTRGLIIISANQNLNERCFSYDTANCCTLFDDNNCSNEIDINNNINNNNDLNNTNINTNNNPDDHSQQTNQDLNSVQLTLSQHLEPHKNPFQILCEHKCVNCSCSKDSDDRSSST